MMKPQRFLEHGIVASQPSWVLRNRNVELAVTHAGAHMAPVTFCRDVSRSVQPYHISPWQDENPHGLPAVMTPLRGDFFCLPFGGNERPHRGEHHPPHGETAGSNWTLEKAEFDGETATLALRLQTRVRPGIVRREFSLVEGHNAVYSRTLIEGFAGPAPFAHHAILRMPQRPGTLRLFTGRFSFGKTSPDVAGRRFDARSLLEPEASFRSLSRIPSRDRGGCTADLSALPVRSGHGDLFQQFEQTSKPKFSWVAAVNLEENWMWFAFKNALVMPGRLFWIENFSRKETPWNGRTSCLGVEDGRMYFDGGLHESCHTNPASLRGVPTSVRFRENTPFEIRYIQGAVTLPAGFREVSRLTRTASAVLFHNKHGRVIEVPVHHDFLKLEHFK
jgi:hypothetical protein